MRAAQWQRNALFRLLAFLDNTGTQSFDLQRDLVDNNDSDNSKNEKNNNNNDESGGRGRRGVLRSPATTFAADTPAHAILTAGLHTLRQHIVRLCADAAERDALLRIVGIGGVESLLPSSSSSSSLLPAQTACSDALLAPSSLDALAGVLEDELPLHLHHRLCELLRLDNNYNNSSHKPPPRHATDTPLTEQFLIDALDAWLCDVCDDAEVDRIVRACGVQPSVLAAVRARPAVDARNALSDFVIDVVYPLAPSSSSSRVRNKRDSDGHSRGNDEDDRAASALLDWLLLCYAKNHESVSVDDDDDDERSDTQPPSHNGNDDDDAVVVIEEEEEHVVTTNDDNSDDDDKACKRARVDADDELLLTPDNVEAYMRTRPSLVPREVVRARRRSWHDAHITAFELEQHYTAAELRAAVRQVAALQHAPASAWQSLAHELGHDIDAHVVRAAATATRKQQYVDVLLQLHASSSS